MIFTNRTIKVNKGKSTIDEPIILYRGDFEVELRFTIMETKYRFKSGVNLVDSEKASHAQLALLAPDGTNVFTEIGRCEDGTAIFVLSKEMIDELSEVGLYSFQIRLFDYYRESRISIPPVEFGIEVREPIAAEDHTNTVDDAMVGYSIAKTSVLDEPVPETFDANGQYNKTYWETGDRISEGKLNKMEDAIHQINQNELNDVAALDKRVTSNFNVLNNSKADAGGKINISQLDTNAGKIKQEHLDSTLIKQIAGDAAVNAVPATDSITTDMLTNSCITMEKLKTLGYIIKHDMPEIVAERIGDILRVSFTGNIWIYKESGTIHRTLNGTGNEVYEMPNWSVLVYNFDTRVISVLDEGVSVNGRCVILGINNNGLFLNGLLADIKYDISYTNRGPAAGSVSTTNTLPDPSRICGISNVVYSGDGSIATIDIVGPIWVNLPNGDYLTMNTGSIIANRKNRAVRLTLPEEMQFVGNYHAQIKIKSAHMLVYNFEKGSIRVVYDNLTSNINAHDDDIILLYHYRGRIAGGALASNVSSSSESPFIEYQIYANYKSTPFDLIRFEAPEGHDYGKPARVTVDGRVGKIWYYCTDGTLIWYDAAHGSGFNYTTMPDGCLSDDNVFSIEVPHNHCLVYSMGAISIQNVQTAAASGVKILAACHEGYIKSGILFDILLHMKHIHADELNKDENNLQPIPDYYKEHLESKIAIIKNKHITFGMDVTSFAFITDMHWTTNSKISPRLLGEVCKQCDIEYIFNGGDWVNNASKDKVINQLTEIKDLFEANNILDKTMMVLGNHDDNSIYNIASETILQPHMFDLMFRDITLNNHVVSDADADAMGYYYRDDNFNRIRYIVLNCIDTVYQIDNINDTITYGGQHSYEFREQQVKWFCETALDVPSDKWSVVVCSHIPPIKHNITGSDTAPTYGQHMIEILKAFKNKTSYSATASGGKFGNYNIDVDFRNKGGNVITWLGGHVHYDNIVNHEGINIVTTLNNDASEWSDAPVKTRGDYTEQAFDIFTINKKTRTVDITRIGVGSNRSFTY